VYRNNIIYLLTVSASEAPYVQIITMMTPQPYIAAPVKVVQGPTREITCFNTVGDNIDASVVESFGEEWTKFSAFDDAEIAKIGDMYFDIIDDTMVNKNSYCIDIGCGTGRWTKYLAPKIGYMEAVDPSKALLSADKLLQAEKNVRLTMASTDHLPFPDETFDFGMSIGVLHHIPNTPKALADCVKKIKIGGHFYTYLYYSLDNRGFVFRALHGIVTAMRLVVSRLPSAIKKIVCDIIAVCVYMPVIIFGRVVRALGGRKLSMHIPLHGYHDTSFFVVRNDALDRFGTTLEQRFSRQEIIEMMKASGLDNIVVSDNLPYWHAVGKRVR
jgi:SAM-dependent methyltransferase